MDLASAPAARRHVRDTARAWELPADQAEALEAITAELGANALEHGRGESVTVALALTAKTVRVSVTDEGRGVAYVREEDGVPEEEEGEPRCEGGRGLLIVAALADRWGQRRTPDGLTVWADTDGSGAADAPCPDGTPWKPPPQVP